MHRLARLLQIAAKPAVQADLSLFAVTPVLYVMIQVWRLISAAKAHSHHSRRCFAKGLWTSSVGHLPLCQELYLTELRIKQSHGERSEYTYHISGPSFAYFIHMMYTVHTQKKLSTNWVCTSWRFHSFALVARTRTFWIHIAGQHEIDDLRDSNTPGLKRNRHWTQASIKSLKMCVSKYRESVCVCVCVYIVHIPFYRCPACPLAGWSQSKKRSLDCETTAVTSTIFESTPHWRHGFPPHGEATL